jgi:putative endonuclease
MNPTRGRAAEALAASFLELMGLQVLDRNRRAGGGEIDLIARDADSLVFVEVRLRARGQWAGAGRSISKPKQRRLRLCAQALLERREWEWPGRSLRFDVVLLESFAGGLNLWHHRNVRLAGELPRWGGTP